MGFPYAPLRIRSSDPDIGAERDLQPAAVAISVNRGDYRHRQLHPRGRHALEEVGAEIIAPDSFFGEAFAASRGEPADVDSGTEARPFTVKHDRPQALLVQKAERRFGQRPEHAAIQCVVLVASNHRDLGHVVFDPDLHPVFRH